MVVRYPWIDRYGCRGNRREPTRREARPDRLSPRLRRGTSGCSAVIYSPASCLSRMQDRPRLRRHFGLKSSQWDILAD